MVTRIRADRNSGFLSIQIEDNGKGMTPEFLAGVTDPFSTTRTTRKVGLGLSLFKEACEITGGYLTIESTQYMGTKVEAVLAIFSIDRIPLGNTGETLSGLISSYPDRDFAIVFSNDQGEEAGLDTAEIREKLGDVPLSAPDVYVFIRDYIQEQQQIILGGI
jgi:signal transduction histidine kinase